MCAKTWKLWRTLCDGGIRVVQIAGAKTGEKYRE